MSYKILVVKETRAGETRVALIPSDVAELVRIGHTVYVEKDAGLRAGYSDQEYMDAGASIRHLESNTPEGYRHLFTDITHIVRVKRPDREREKIENQVIANGIIMIGALDPLEIHSPHLSEYKQAGIKVHSIDQLSLPANHPMNILAAMSKIAGKLALLDAMEKFSGTAKEVFIIGYGTAGKSACDEALKQGMNVTIAHRGHPHSIAEVVTRSIHINEIEKVLYQADIVITSARRNNETAPILVTEAMLEKMKAGSVIVDLALSEGGNVAGSKHDATLILGNNIIVTNVSGYPKAEPKQASKLWSKASLLYLQSIAS